MSPAGMRATRRRVVRTTLLGVVMVFGAVACGTSGDAPEPTGAPEVPAARDLPPASAGSPQDGSGPDGAEDADEKKGKDEADVDGEPRNEPGIEVDARAGQLPLPAVEEVRCPAATVTVSSADELTAALAGARPGQVIALADGVYVGNFVATTAASPEEPIFLCGGRGAVLDGGDVESGYVLHLDGATHWRLVGFSIRNGQKGLMAEGTVWSVVQGLSVTGIGDEAVHLRRASTDNLVIGNEISGTGLRKEKFGEGVYIGTAVSNWCTVSGCLPDRSDRNVVARNAIRDTTSEGVDIKEGTTGGLLVDNTFDGSATAAADS